jgi:hypothetical protein
MPARKAWDYMQRDAQSMREDGVPAAEIKQIMDDRLQKMPGSSTLHRGKKSTTKAFNKGGLVKKGRKRII